MDCLQHWASIGSFYREDALIRQSKGSFEVAHWLNNTHLNDIQHNHTITLATVILTYVIVSIRQTFFSLFYIYADCHYPEQA
jgi:hypothetical protein